MYAATPPHIRFFRYVRKESEVTSEWVETPCWIWTASKRALRYGSFAISRGVNDYAHRWSYRYHKGEIPNDKVIRHLCDNPLCVNPDHLAVGSRKDNEQDKYDHGRAVVGSEHPHAKLTNEDVRAMRADRLTGMTYLQLADKYGVCRDRAWKICTGKSWKHILPVEVQEDRQENE